MQDKLYILKGQACPLKILSSLLTTEKNQILVGKKEKKNHLNINLEVLHTGF